MIILDFETEMVGDYGDAVPRPLEVAAVSITPNFVIQSFFTRAILSDRPIKPRPEEFRLRMPRENAVSFPEAMCELKVWAGPAYDNSLWSWPASFESAVLQDSAQRLSPGVCGLPRIGCVWSHVRGLMGKPPTSRLKLIEAADILGVDYMVSKLHDAQYDLTLMVKVWAAAMENSVVPE